MKMDNSTRDYWDKRYNAGSTGWDIGYASPALIAYCKGMPTNMRILIPGAGSAYEWIALRDMGFTNVTILDISKVAIERLKLANPHQAHQFQMEDFFNHSEKYDLILEQTFFSALNPSLRLKYVRKMRDLLADNGKLAGILFSREFSNEGPPYGGSIEEYTQLFNTCFESFDIEPCLNSIPARLGSEAFFVATRHA